MKILSQAPTRISLFGGGTDLPVFSNRFGGTVISMAVNIYQRFFMSDGEKKEWKTVSDNQDFYNTIFKWMDYEPNAFRQDFDGSIESGLGSSASCAVGMIAAITRLKGKYMTREQIAEKAWDIEVNGLKMYGGKQDQYAAAYGGMNVIYFNETVQVDPFERWRSERLVDNLLLFYIGENRQNPKIQEELFQLDQDKINSLQALKEIAEAAIGYLWTKDWPKVAELLDSSWHYKKLSNPKITTEKVDELYAKAKEAGAKGGKLCGSGGGGHMVFMASPEKQQKVTSTLLSLGCTPVDFSIDWSGVTTKFL